MGIRFGSEFGQEMVGEVIEIGSSISADIKVGMRVIEHIANNKTNIGSIVTQVYKLDQIQEAFNKAIESKGTIKVVVDLT